ncbi:MAG: tetratricopeptide repeat protein [Oligoflexales bacterium]
MAIEKILILDQVDTNVLFFDVLLQSLDEKFEIHTATTGAEAEEIVEKCRIQFVICAWEMDAMPGTVFVQRVRNHRSRRHMPCLIFSKRMNEQDIKLTKELGLPHILGMPFDKSTAKEMVQGIIDAEKNLSPVEAKIRKIEGMILEGQPTEALKMVNSSVTKKGPFRARAKTAVGEIWFILCKYDRAEKVLKEAIDDTEDYVPALRLLAQVYSKMSRHDESIDLLKKLTEASPCNIQSLLNLGSAYVEADRHDEARDVFEQVEKLDSDNRELQDEQGKLAFKEGDIPLAMQLLAQTQCGDDLARHFNSMAIALVAGGDYAKGLETYDSAIQILGDKAKLHLLHFNKGLALRKSGDMQKAFSCFCESYKSDPDYERAYSAVAMMVKELKSQSIDLDDDLIKSVQEARQQHKGVAQEKSA